MTASPQGALAQERMPPGRLNVPSVDVFVTYRCNFRCAHCFLGDALDTRRDFPFPAFEKLCEECRGWGTEEITFLGGEPTLYPQINAAIDLCRVRGFRARIVTNGSVAYQRFLSNLRSAPPHVAFSLDGGSAATHDRIRHTGSFDQLCESVRASRARGIVCSGIISFSRRNLHDVDAMLERCREFEFIYTNVHYVSNRGFAKPEDVIGVTEWLRLCHAIRRRAEALGIDVRLEETFGPKGNFTCAIRGRNNLMFLPDGRVFMCMLFIDIPGAHAFTWTEAGLIGNEARYSEMLIAQRGCGNGCPAMRFVNPRIQAAADQQGLTIGCMYQKTQLGGSSKIGISFI